MAVFLIGFSVGVARTQNLPLIQDSNGVASVAKVALLINDSEKIKSYRDINLNQSSTVLTILEQTAATERFAVEVDRSSSLGAFVKQIGQKKNGQNQFYWQYYVNGSQPLVAADKFILQGGETVLWTFSQSEY